MLKEYKSHGGVGEAHLPLLFPDPAYTAASESMPKFKLKYILSRVILGESIEKEHDPGYLRAGIVRYTIESPFHAHLERAAYDEDDDDGHSMISISSMETVDNHPGTGRTVDMYIYQPMGRWIERLAMRFTIASLHPAHIAQYIEARCLSDRFDNASTIVAGMKGLVKQTQSNSIDKSALALAALIRVSLTQGRREIYVNVSCIEPIFHLELLVRPLPSSHPEKKWLLLLLKLAKETLIAVKMPLLDAEVFWFATPRPSLWPSPETALLLRQRLKRALMVYRCSGQRSLEDTVGEACAVCAEAVSTCIHGRARGDAYMHILETVYYTVIFVLRSIHELANLARITANRHVYMVIQTTAFWIDAIVFRCLYTLEVEDDRPRSDINVLKDRMAFRSLRLVYDETARVFLPQSYSFQVHDLVVLDTNVLPRRHREAINRFHHNSIARGLMELAEQRTRRLLRSFDELERETWGCTLQTDITTSQLKVDDGSVWENIYDFADVWWEHWRSTLTQARRVQVLENCLTEEFRQARRIGLERDPSSDPSDISLAITSDGRNWGYYQLRRSLRYKWGKYLCSSMDWDWDLGTCMKRLFKERHVKQTSDVHSVPVSSPAIEVAASPDGALKISIGQAQVGVPNEI